MVQWFLGWLSGICVTRMRTTIPYFERIDLAITDNATDSARRHEKPHVLAIKALMINEHAG